jgi:hypothetical protein
MNEDELKIKVKRGPKRGDSNDSFSGMRQLLGEEFAQQLVDEAYAAVASGNWDTGVKITRPRRRK